jgi:DNA-binding Lrp family transcriptional regulator
MTRQQIRDEHEREILKLLEGGAKVTRHQVISALNDTISEGTVQTIMEDLERRGLVKITRAKPPKRYFSKFMYIYEKAPAA